MQIAQPAVYPIHRTATPPRLDAPWDDVGWAAAVSADVGCVNNKAHTSGHHPRTTAQLLHDDEAFYLRYRVEDRYVRVQYTGNQSSVWNDSCVEFFFQPDGADEYLNLETNAGGHKLLHRNRIDARGDWQWERMPEAQLDAIAIWHSLPARIDPERVGDVTWHLAARIPFSIMRSVWPGLEVGPGVRWRGNFYKCGDETSHPHWLSWQPARENPFAFHDPTIFGGLVMA